MMQFAISSWSVHGLLGEAIFEQRGADYGLASGRVQGAVSLLELPRQCAENGIHLLEICHFHFPSTEDAYLMQLKQALDENKVTLLNILVDRGNLSNSDEAQRRADIEMAKSWQVVAAKVGALGNRMDCGTEPATVESIGRAADSLRELITHADSLGLKVVTENFRQTSVEPASLLAIMQQVAPHSLGLCVDFGNAEHSADKALTLKTLMPYATLIHCKANEVGDDIDWADLEQSLDIMRSAEFNHPITLIYGETEDEWQHILELKQAVETICQ